MSTYPWEGWPVTLRDIRQICSDEDCEKLVVSQNSDGLYVCYEHSIKE